MSRRNGYAFFRQYLYDHTDEEHKASSTKLCELMRENGYSADSRTIHRYALQMQEEGDDILYERRRGVPSTYYVCSHGWDLSELRILIDAVASAQFITREKSEQIIGKLSKLAGEWKEHELTPNVYVSEHIKADNEQILVSLEEISYAIRNKKKIRFKCANHNTDKEIIFRTNGTGEKKEDYIISPFATIWKEDRYYVIGKSVTRPEAKCVSFRLDRIMNPVTLEEDAEEPDADFNLQDYAEKFTRMYGGREAEVTLRCRKDKVDTILDKFGMDAEIFNVTEKTFDVRATVAVGGTFLAWMFQYAGDIMPVGPEDVTEMYLEMMRTATKTIEDGEIAEKPQVWKLK